MVAHRTPRASQFARLPLIPCKQIIYTVPAHAYSGTVGAPSVLVLSYQRALVATETLKNKSKVDFAKQRRSPRIKLQVPVFVRGADASGVEFIELTKTLNISATGASIASTHILRPEQGIHLTIPTPSPASSGLVPSETPPISARVLREEALGDIRVFGVEFLRALDS